MAGNIVPRTDGGSNLGTADKEFNVIYAKSFGGTIASQVVTTNSPTFTGTPAAPTAAAGTNTTQIATTAFANTAASAAASSAVSTHNLASDAHSATIAAAVNTHNAATDAHSTEFAKYLPLSGGALTGTEIRRNNSTSMLDLRSGTSWSDGAYLRLRGSNQSGTDAGSFELSATTSDSSRVMLTGRPDGSLTWAGKEIKSMAFPSSTTVAVSLTFTSGSATYTAPANGYLTVNAKSTAATYACLNINNGACISERQNVTSNGEYMCSTIPVLKGNVCNIFIGGSASFVNARFIYALGEV